MESTINRVNALSHPEYWWLQPYRDGMAVTENQNYGWSECGVGTMQGRAPKRTLSPSLVDCDVRRASDTSVLSAHERRSGCTETPVER